MVDTNILPAESRVGRIQTISFNTAFIEWLLKTGERNLLSIQ